MTTHTGHTDAIAASRVIGTIEDEKTAPLVKGGAVCLAEAYSAKYGATGGECPCGGSALHDVMNAATMRNKLTIPDNSDMAKLPRFRPARNEA